MELSEPTIGVMLEQQPSPTAHQAGLAVFTVAAVVLDALLVAGLVTPTGPWLALTKYPLALVAAGCALRIRIASEALVRDLQD
ncbi:MAG: hypothetical protein CMQ43_02350 [Gammaproteobacteria bacterium]|nr:hypothetical protein [Gammaproteobacteria bacterium]|tara:strand:- start:521 stop:769 length:249 start_codon:yes stop_codon:yes gene_type:complete